MISEFSMPTGKCAMKSTNPFTVGDRVVALYTLKYEGFCINKGESYVVCRVNGVYISLSEFVFYNCNMFPAESFELYKYDIKLQGGKPPKAQKDTCGFETGAMYEDMETHRVNELRDIVPCHTQSSCRRYGKGECPGNLVFNYTPTCCFNVHSGCMIRKVSLNKTGPMPEKGVALPQIDARLANTWASTYGWVDDVSTAGLRKALLDIDDGTQKNVKKDGGTLCLATKKLWS